MNKDRLIEIIQIAKKLDWIFPVPRPNPSNFSYPLMQLSEVEKCMLAMFDDFYLERMRKWARDVDDGTWARTREEAQKLKEQADRMATEVVSL